MRYILADIDKAKAAGFLEVAHRTNDRIMCLNENEVMASDKLTGTLEERAATLGGRPMTRMETFQKIGKKGKYRILTVKQ